LYLQVVNGESATSSGLQLIPMMAGLLVTSIASGQVIARIGRYRLFPIMGTGVMIGGFLLLSRMGPETSSGARALYLVVLGLGLGMVMQVLVLAVQNAVDYRHLGVATSGATFFRTIGGSVGVAVFGAIFSNRLTHELMDHLGAAGLPPRVLPAGGEHLDPARLAKLPPPVHDAVVQAYADALHPVFLTAAGIAVLAFALSWLLEEVPLRTTAGAAGLREAFAVPGTGSSLDEIGRSLSVLSSRDARRRFWHEIPARAGVDLPPGEAWLLARIKEGTAAALRPDVLSRGTGPSVERIAELFRSLEERGLIKPPVPLEDGAVWIELTPAGEAANRRLVAAARERLAEQLEGWEPERYPDLARLLSTLARDVTVEHSQAPAPAHS
jgi:MFS family permease